MTRNPLRRGPSGASSRRWLLLLAVVGLVALFFLLDLPGKLSLEALREAHGSLLAWRERAPFRAAALYGLAYVVVTGLSLPGAAVMTLAGGAIFGLGLGTLLVSFASSAGATIAFLLARTLLREPMLKRFGARLAPIEEGHPPGRVLYLLSLRLVPVFPFFLVNILMGLTEMPMLRYALVSQLGMLPGTIVYVNAGTQLAPSPASKGILSPPVLGRWPCWRSSPGSRAGCWAVEPGSCTGPGPAGPLRSQPDRDRRRRRRAGHRLHRRHREGQGDPDRGRADGRRLPQHRLRAQQGPDRTARLAARMRHADRYGLPPTTPRWIAAGGAGAGAPRWPRWPPTTASSATRAWGWRCCSAMPAWSTPGPWRSRRSDGSEQPHQPAIVLATGASPVW
jgi:uncharacterized membrane protein YdjX (TVP38/TMEM64 family)